MTHNTELTILSTAIRRDAEGRYCLNDCHKASGGAPNKAPSEWAKNKQTKALIAELGASGDFPTPLNVLNDGKNNGTYIAKELVYAYAMWISPAFHLQVIRAFDAMVMGRIEQPASKSLSAKEVGGIVKSVVTKMKSDLLAELKAEIRGQLTPAQQELSDHAVAVVKEKIAEKQDLVETRIPGQIAAFRLPADLIPKRRPNTGTCRLPVGEVARRLGIGTVKVNAMLADLGLQSPGTTNQPWMVTDNGELFGVQSTKRLILWSARVLDALRWKMEQEGSAAPFAKSPEPATT